MVATATDLSRLRDGSASLVTLALADLDALLRSADGQAEQALRDVLPALIATYGLAAAALAADWYDDVRDASGVRGRFTAIPVDIPDAGADALVGWAITEATSDESLRALIAGGTQRRIMNFSRGTITGSAVADPAADGWQRVTSGTGCAFCRMVAGRGAVYSEATADFAAHDDCNCEAVPAFGGESVPVKPYTPSLRGTSEADQERARKWMRDNGLL